MRNPLLRAHVLFQFRSRHPLETRLAGDSRLLRRFDDGGRDADTRPPHLRHGRIDAVGHALREVGQCVRRGHHHAVRHFGDLRQHCRKSQAREDKCIVPLPDLERRAPVLDRRERAPGRDDRFALAPGDHVLGDGLRRRTRVREREDHRPLGVCAHRLDDLAVEPPGVARQTHHGGRLRGADRLEETGAAFEPQRLGGGLRLRVRALESVHLAPLDEQPARVEDQHPGPRVFGAQPSVHQALGQRPGYTDAPRAGPVDDEALLGDRHACQLAGSQHSRKHRRTGALDVVVERRQSLPVALQNGERDVLREILPLKDGARVAGCEGFDEAVDHREVGLTAKPGVPHADVERVVDQVLAVGPNVELDRECLVRSHTPGHRVNRELADADRHAAEALVTDPEDRGRIGRDREPDVLEGNVRQCPLGLVDVRRRDGKPSRQPVDPAEELHGLCNGRRVNDGQHLFEVFRDECIEEDLVSILEEAQVDVLVERRRLAGKLRVDALLLLIDDGDAGGEEPFELQQVALLIRERGPLVEEGDALEWHAGHVDLEVAVAVFVPANIVVPADGWHFSPSLVGVRNCSGNRPLSTAGSARARARGARHPGSTGPRCGAHGAPRHRPMYARCVDAEAPA